ncbi:hypothetical protein PN36_24565 [Candidatus Thiomargarita nelsonii]|uniref:DUF4139 domain-containing protein n=1 Tax=Candidatus Thiomargarita nelsonii TaxID=1003181 RepID=A0A0A6P8I5_9GAMM|nr:hypothetical protein PN36_24565 [Candidatus Thiomargarita nelsonii]
MCKKALICLVAIVLPLELYAKIDLVTLPVRDQVQLTIYNAADLTLVREQRTLTLKQGINRLEFGWADTLIDPTSVYLDAPQHAGKVNLLEVAYPPNVKGSAIWTIESQVAGAVPVDISFFTSGLSWRAFYMCTLSTDEKMMRLQNYVRVDNRSGEDYLNAETRVVVGKIHLLDKIAELAQRHPPYGMPPMDEYALADDMIVESDLMIATAMQFRAAPKKIIKEGLSEYFLYSIEGTETIRNGWGKRLIALDVEKLPVRALYRYDEYRYGKQAQRLLFFKNDKAHQLGETPLPDGKVMIYRQLADKHLSYVAATNTQYIPVEQEVELDLGAARYVKVEPVLIDYRTENYVFDLKGNISGHDRVQTWQLKLENNRDLPVELEIFQHFQHPHWTIEAGTYEKVDLDTIKYRLTLPARTKEYLLTYTLTLFEGERRRKSR